MLPSICDFVSLCHWPTLTITQSCWNFLTYIHSFSFISCHQRTFFSVCQSLASHFFWMTLILFCSPSTLPKITLIQPYPFPFTRLFPSITLFLPLPLTLPLFSLNFINFHSLSHSLSLIPTNFPTFSLSHLLAFFLTFFTLTFSFSNFDFLTPPICFILYLSHSYILSHSSSLSFLLFLSLSLSTFLFLFQQSH